MRTIPYPPATLEAHSSTWPHPTEPSASAIASSEQAEKLAQARGRRLRLASPETLGRIYTEGAPAPAAAAVDEAIEQARHGRSMADAAENLPHLVAQDNAARENELLAMYALSPRNKLTAGYNAPAQGPPGAAYLSARSKVDMMAAAYHKSGGSYHAKVPAPPPLLWYAAAIMSTLERAER